MFRFCFRSVRFPFLQTDIGPRSNCSAALNIAANCNLQKDPLEAPYENKLLCKEIAKSWFVFSKQVDAFAKFSEFDSVQGCEKKEYGVFAFEPRNWKSGSCRRFIVTQVRTFWQVYCQLPPDCRFVHEVIVDGRPCRPYFDLEFYRAFNPDLNGTDAEKRLIQLFVDFMTDGFNEMFSITPSSIDVLKLFSSTEQKFSSHMIFHLPDNKVFASSLQMRDFILRRSKTLRDTVSKSCNSSDLGMLLIRNDRGERRPLWDEQVYGKNKSLRIFMSCKRDKQNPFKVSTEDMLKWPQVQNLCAKMMNISENISPEKLLGDFDVSKFQLSSSALSCGDAKLKLQNALARRIFRDSLICNVGHKPQMLPLLALSSSEFSSSFICAEGHEVYSEYPELMKHMADVIQRKSRFAKIYKCAVLKSGCVVITVQGGYCHNIGRPHRSNWVYYLVDLSNRKFYQKCFDYDCHGFRSKSWPLPNGVLV